MPNEQDPRQRPFSIVPDLSAESSFSLSPAERELIADTTLKRVYRLLSRTYDMTAQQQLEGGQKLFMRRTTQDISATPTSPAAQFILISNTLEAPQGNTISRAAAAYFTQRIDGGNDSLFPKRVVRRLLVRETVSGHEIMSQTFDPSTNPNAPTPDIDSLVQVDMDRIRFPKELSAEEQLLVCPVDDDSQMRATSNLLGTLLIQYRMEHADVHKRRRFFGRNKYPFSPDQSP